MARLPKLVGHKLLVNERELVISYTKDGCIHLLHCLWWQLRHVAETERELDEADVSTPHLPGRLDSLPDAEVADKPDGGQTQSQLPADRAEPVQSAGQAEHLPPLNTHAAGVSTKTVSSLIVNTLKMLHSLPKLHDRGSGVLRQAARIGRLVVGVI